MQTCVAIKSLVDNYDENKKISIFIICDGLNDEQIRIIESNKAPNAQIHTISVDSDKYCGLEKKYSNVSRAAMLKFEIPLIIEQEIALYLDGDVIVRNDISDLFNIQLDDNYAAVVRDGPKPKRVPGGKKHSYYGNRNYFNSGVMLLNLKQLREDNISEKLINYRKQEYNYFMDQDAFNNVFQGKVIYLPLQYDFMLHLISFKNESFTLDQLSIFYDDGHYETIDDLFKSVKIIHYTFDKPWKYYDIPFADEWYKYYLLTPFSSVKLYRISYLTNRIYKTKTYSFSRCISKIIRLFLFWKYK